MPRLGVAPPPPIPDDPKTCRWCGKTRVRLREVEGDPYLCAAGCADTLSAPYYRQCDDCGREFNTGKAFARQCYPCEAKERSDNLAAADGERRITGYLEERIKWGANRRVIRAIGDR